MKFKTIESKIDLSYSCKTIREKIVTVTISINFIQILSNFVCSTFGSLLGCSLAL